MFPLHLIIWISRGESAVVNGVTSRCNYGNKIQFDDIDFESQFVRFRITLTSVPATCANSMSCSSWSSTTPESSRDDSRLPPPSLVFELACRLVGINCPR